MSVGKYRSGPQSVCALITALKEGPTRKTVLAAKTGQSEKTVAEWLKFFRAAGHVRVAALEKDSRGHMQVECYKWIELAEPTEDVKIVVATPSERAKAYRAKGRALRVVAVNEPKYQPKTVFATGVNLWTK